VHVPTAVWHKPSKLLASAASPLEFTVKVVEAWAGFSVEATSKPAVSANAATRANTPRK
jgi:hypothetical protein